MAWHRKLEKSNAGSTVRPKGVRFGHGARSRGSYHYVSQCEIGPVAYGDGVLVQLPNMPVTGLRRVGQTTGTQIAKRF